MDRLRTALAGVAKDVFKKIDTDSVLGLGSGSTVATLIEELSPLLMTGGKKVTGVTTSA